MSCAAHFTAEELLSPRPLARRTWDLLGIPLRFVLLPDAWSKRFGWSSLEEERLRAVLPCIRGRLLDVGCGTNNLVRSYPGEGVGVDVHDFGGGGVIVPDTRRLPMPDASFDTVTFIACLNHIPYRLEALREACRVLRPGGRLIATMIGRLPGRVGHAIWWYGEDRHRGGMAEGETGGLDPPEIHALLAETGFDDVRHTRFCYGLNSLYRATKPDSPKSV